MNLAFENGSASAPGSAQKNIASAGKYLTAQTGKPRTRDWQLYLFFRIMKQSEVDSLGQSAEWGSGLVPNHEELAGRLLLQDIDTIWSAPRSDDQTIGLAEQAASFTANALKPDRPADGFRAWLRLASGYGVPSNALDMLQTFASKSEAESLSKHLAKGFEIFQPKALGVLSAIEEIALPKEGRVVVEQGLTAILVHEFLRHILMGDKRDTGGAVQAISPQASLANALATEGDQVGVVGKLAAKLSGLFGSDDQPYDTSSINIGFTHKGLEALQLNSNTLLSFPESFRDGMAARAQRLGDTGANAPENWYGELGSSRIHGYFTGGFEASGATEAAWEKVRTEIDIFNTRDPSGQLTRAALRLLFLPFGMEILHIELGQAPYEVEEKKVKPILPRIEHFGFRDGISQPFADFQLKPDGSVASDNNSGTPSRNRTWTPLATGELFLGHPDEDGQIIQQPANATLRNDGTYLVFRKLEQDVVGFRNFLAQQRPGDSAAQKKLSAQMVGRWPNGAPLVLSPDAEREGDEEQINDFLYAADDPDGKKCPLGAHIRRTNPRDIGGRNNVRRHRLMRRSIAYGGAKVAEGAIGNGRERGMLFFAANSRIDMQFEVIQADWINGGEFLGQAGLGKCPLTGNNQGASSDSFFEAGSGIPVTAIPSFVRLRGGDYFFLPSGDALRALGDPKNLLPPDVEPKFDGHSFGDSVTEELFSKKRVVDIVGRIAFKGSGPIGIRPPPVAADVSGSTFEGPYDGSDVIFVGSHKDVTKVLSSQPQGPDTPMAFTAARSRIAGKAMLRTHNLLVGTDWNHSTAAEREVLADIAQSAWSYPGVNWQGKLNAIMSRSLRKTILRIAPRGHVDLVRDFAADVVYDIVSDLFGTPGPDYLSELAVALPFSESRITQVDREWLAGLRSEGSSNPGLDSYKIWSFLVGLNLVADLKNQQEVERLGMQASAEALLHLDLLIDRERARPRSNPPVLPSTLLGAMVAIEAEMIRKHAELLPTSTEYYGYVRSLLFELTLTASSIIPAVFGTILDAIFETGQNLGDLAYVLKKEAEKPGAPISFDQALVRIIYEVNRLRPAQPIVMRLCEVEQTLPSGAVVEKDQWVAALVVAANIDRSIFRDPKKFSLFPLVKGHPERNLADYLMFGVDPRNSNLNPPASALPPRTCWGRDRIAISSLVACLKAAAGLPGLRRVAGPRGQLQTTLGISSGLLGKFAPFTAV
jgi:deferrochelatase/peroxidase EfeB